MFQKNNPEMKGIATDPFSIAKYLAIAGMLAYAFYPTFIWMLDRWGARDSYYGHGYLVPIIALYWIYKRKDTIASLDYKGPSLFGWSVLLIGVALQVLASFLRIYFVSGFAFILILLGCVDLLFGRNQLKPMWFPISFMSVMIPLPLLVISQITIKMKFFVSEISIFALNRMGIPAIREGSYIFTKNAVLLVGDPCSGLRSFLAFLCLGVVFAYESRMSLPKKFVLVALGLPLAILSNVLRVTFLSIVGESYGMEYTEGFVHDVSGVAVFVLAFIAFLIIKAKLEGGKNEKI